MAKHNQHWYHTHTELQNIVFDLMRTDQVAEITVARVCRLANINRTTFYMHFRDVYDLIDVTAKNKRHELMANFRRQQSGEMTVFQNQALLVRFLTFVRTNGWFYKIVLARRTEFPIAEGFEQLYARVIGPLKNRQPELTEAELMYYFVGFQASFTMILRRWVEGDYLETPDTIARIISQALPYVVFDALARTNGEYDADNGQDGTNYEPK